LVEIVRKCGWMAMNGGGGEWGEGSKGGNPTYLQEACTEQQWRKERYYKKGSVKMS